MKPAILLAAYGSRTPGARESLTHIERRVKENFPAIPVTWAYTSEKVRRKLAGEGTVFDSVAKALARLDKAGCTQVAVQSLHVVPGEEYGSMVRAAEAFRAVAAAVTGLAVGGPLLSDDLDVAEAAEAILERVPAGRRPDEPVILMGHGAGGQGPDMYRRLQEALARRDPAMLVGVLEGEPSMATLVARLTMPGPGRPRRVYLLPLLVSAGQHVDKDMLGDSPTSWKSFLQADGIDAVPVPMAAAEVDGFAAIWLRHLRCSLQTLGVIAPSGPVGPGPNLTPQDAPA